MYCLEYYVLVKKKEEIPEEGPVYYSSKYIRLFSSVEELYRIAYSENLFTDQNIYYFITHFITRQLDNWLVDTNCTPSIEKRLTPRDTSLGKDI